jgi:hypothetical protein
MFRTTYIPVIDSRIKQYKEYLGEFHYDGSIKYNQTAELVDSEMYGEHLKGLLRKIGNKTKRVIYIFDNIDDVPEIGTIVGDYSVYNVSMSIREDKVVATIYYVKYAELSQYIGVKNAWKDSDVSTEKCYSRQISYNEFILITHNSKEEGTSEALTDTGLIYILPQGGGNADVITCVEATGYTSDGTALNTVLLPVVSLAMGNSIMFQWEYKNNYSAGYMSEVAPTEATSLLSGTRYNRCQKAVKYADNYGKLKTYSFSLLHEGPTASNSHWLEDDGTLINGGTNNNEKNAAITRNIAHSLPLKADNIKEEVEYESGEDGEESTIKYEAWEGLKYVDVKDLLIEKNSGEALKFSVQFHYCTDQDDIIIGSGLTNYCPLVGGSMDVVWSLYMFKRRLNYCDRRIDISDAVYGGYIGQKINRPQQRIEIELPDEINGYLSWAIVGRKNGLNYQLIFGENRAFNGANFDRNLYIVPKHKV